jgi:hypothetical protein
MRACSGVADSFRHGAHERQGLGYLETALKP